MYRLPTLGRLKGPQHRLLVPSLLRTLRASGDATHCSSCYQTSVIAAADENLPLGVRASMMTSNELGFVCPFCGEYNAGKRNDDANLERFFRAEGIGGGPSATRFNVPPLVLMQRTLHLLQVLEPGTICPMFMGSNGHVTSTG